MLLYCRFEAVLSVALTFVVIFGTTSDPNHPPKCKCINFMSTGGINSLKSGGSVAINVSTPPPHPICA
uniref:Secreted protein n=1 Tax=Panagrellus redivivus TaxID=6233 RepID=A0A7E4W2Z8_PANRE